MNVCDFSVPSEVNIHVLDYAFVAFNYQMYLPADTSLQNSPFWQEYRQTFLGLFSPEDVHTVLIKSR